PGPGTRRPRAGPYPTGWNSAGTAPPSPDAASQLNDSGTLSFMTPPRPQATEIRLRANVTTELPLRVRDRSVSKKRRAAPARARCRRRPSRLQWWGGPPPPGPEPHKVPQATRHTSAPPAVGVRQVRVADRRRRRWVT